MEIIKSMDTTLKKQLFKFAIAGVIAVLTDLIVYYVLIGSYGHSFSKGVSFLIGTFVSFVINKFWTFNKDDEVKKDLFKFLTLYGGSLCANIVVNSQVLIYSSSVIVAFVFATGMSMTINFIGQKWWVFKR